MDSGLIFTNDNCIGCNKCVRICCSFGASVSHNNPSHNSIYINSDRCINCGACLEVCTHDARDYHDDTEKLFEDLKNGESISLIVAPAFEAKYPKQFKKILGVLKSLGVKRILPVALGADICTWAYIKLIQEQGYTGRISTPCPVVVSYVEHWKPELISKLMPVKSPMMCAAMYYRKVFGITDKLAFIGPCIAKRNEMDKYPDLVQYNITFPKLFDYVAEHDLKSEETFEGMDAGLGSYYPAPGGLADNIKWFLGDDVPVRVVSGKTYLYQRIIKTRDRFTHDRVPYALIDALNCREGCIEGTAKSDENDEQEIGLAEINDIRTKSKRSMPDSPWAQSLSCEQRLANLNKQFEMLDLNDYLTEFTDRSKECVVSYPTEAEADEIFKSMHKEDEHSRNINCSACGYESCREMMVAIHNGFNTRHNCVYSEKEESIYLAKMSFSDQLTGVMNRNAYERNLSSLYAEGKSATIIAVDVNGLKEANDTEGHAAGDRLIIETAHALANEFGNERVFRTGGDEFLVVLQDYSEKEVTDDINLVKDYLESEHVSSSIGYAYTDSLNSGIVDLIKAADHNMYEEKEHYYEKTGKKRRS